MGKKKEESIRWQYIAGTEVQGSKNNGDVRTLVHMFKQLRVNTYLYLSTSKAKMKTENIP